MTSSQILGDQSLCTYEIIYLFLKGCKCHVLLPYLLWGRFGFNPKTLKGNKEIRIITLFSHLHVREMWDKRRITLPMLGLPVCHPNLDLSWLSTYTWHYVIFFNKYQSSLLTFIKQATTFSKRGLVHLCHVLNVQVLYLYNSHHHHWILLDTGRWTHHRRCYRCRNPENSYEENRLGIHQCLQATWGVEITEMWENGFALQELSLFCFGI